MREGERMVKERHRVFVKSGVTEETTEELLKRHFATFGTVTDVYIPRSFPGPAPKGFAYISFVSDDAVQRAVKEAVHEIDGKHYPVGRAEPRPAERTTWHHEDRKPMHNTEPLLQWPPRYSRSISPRGLLPRPYGGGMPTLDTRASLLPTPRIPLDSTLLGDALSYGSRPSLPYNEGFGLDGRPGVPGGIPLIRNERSFGSYRVFVGGLPDVLVERHIRGHFQKYGAVEDVYFPRERHTGKRRGFCFVRFDSPRTAYFAATQSPRFIHGHEVGEIKVADERQEGSANDEPPDVGLSVDGFGYGPGLDVDRFGYGPGLDLDRFSYGAGAGLDVDRFGYGTRRNVDRFGAEGGYGPDRLRSYKIAPPLYELPRELPRELPTELVRDFSRELPRVHYARLPIRYQPY